MTMKRTATQRLADGLVVLSCLLLLADMVLIFLLPALTYFHSGEPTFMTIAQLQATFAYDFDDGLGNLMRVILYEVWQSPETAVLALFSLGCAVGAAWIFLQGIHVSANVADGESFSPKNAVCFRRAAVGCFLLALAAAGRTLWQIWQLGSPEPLLSCTALLIPLFLTGGLLCLLLSALLHRAAEMKAENDLTS